MTSPVALLLGVHAHQPVGNFPEVVDDAHARCYKPFLETLIEYPEFKFTIHFSGWLLQYLFDKFPQDMALLSRMVARGQAEVFGGGDTEPVLAAIPARDRIGQIRRLSARTQMLLGATPKGAWLTERVWESLVVPALSEAGISMVTVDDYHFLCAGKQPEELLGYFTTEEEGHQLDLFPISEALRYRLPFAPAPEAVAFIESQGREGRRAAAIYFDDIEKFGIWPQTHEWVYGKGWLRQFIEGVLASNAIQTEHFAEYQQRERTQGVIYLPTTSYTEMNEWTLPAPQATRYAQLVDEQKAKGQYDLLKPYIRGGIWRNFLSRYSEANWMHRRMLSLSRRVQALPLAQRSSRLIDLLYQSQANDAYWHGLFGGLYLPHLRRAVFNALVELERGIDIVEPRPLCQRADLDLDGHDEIFLHNDTLQIVVRDDADAAIIEFDAYALCHNFGDTLRRRDEHYYRKMAHGEHAHVQGDGIASAHDRVRFKHAITPADLEADPRPRALFVDQWISADASHQLAPHYVCDPSAPAMQAAFQAEIPGGFMRKSYEVNDDRVLVKYTLRCTQDCRVETRLNLAMPSCDGFLGRFVYEGQIPGGFGQPMALEAASALSLEDGVLGGSVELLLSQPARLHAAPLHTVSQSEDGFEKIMQAVTITLEWALPAGEHELVVSMHAITATRDRTQVASRAAPVGVA